MKELGFDYHKHIHASGVYNLKLRGGRGEMLRFLGTVRPHRLIANWIAQGGAEALGRMHVVERVAVESSNIWVIKRLSLLARRRRRSLPRAMPTTTRRCS